MAVHLTRIYTRTGDDGTTALGDMSRTTKTSVRLAAYADVDETNATIGVALALGALPATVADVLRRIQNELFDVGADLCTPVVADPEFPPLRVTEDYVDRLEADCDEGNERPAEAGQLPAAGWHAGRGPAARRPHGQPPGRAVGLGAAREEPDTTNPLTARYLNRLSDLLFIYCRVANPRRRRAVEAGRRAG